MFIDRQALLMWLYERMSNAENEQNLGVEIGSRNTFFEVIDQIEKGKFAVHFETGR